MGRKRQGRRYIFKPAVSRQFHTAAADNFPDAQFVSPKEPLYSAEIQAFLPVVGELNLLESPEV